MCFYCILKGLFCTCEGTKTWGHGRERAILTVQFLGYLCLFVFSEKRNPLTCWFFAFFCWTMGVLLEYRNPKTNILPLSLLQSCKYDDFYSIFNVGKKQRCDTFWRSLSVIRAFPELPCYGYINTPTRRYSVVLHTLFTRSTRSANVDKSFFSRQWHLAYDNGFHMYITWSLIHANSVYLTILRHSCTRLTFDLMT